MAQLKRHRCDDQDIASAFEGPEKLLEFWFAGAKGASLRTISREQWQEVLDLIHCQVVSSISNEHLDAYVLSESSMFVYPQRVIIKTCGTTTLLNCIKAVLQLAMQCGMTYVQDFFYSRQTFFFPTRQLSPHKAFTDEVTYLDEIFDNGLAKLGAASVLGRLNGPNHYNIYNAENETALPVCRLCGEGDKQVAPEGIVATHALKEDFTLEMMMSGLSPERTKLFFDNGEFDAEQITRESGIADLFPDATLDSFLFSPCGYSMNGLLGDGYFTIHVTPEEKHSYASFETNIPAEGADFRKLVYHVLKLFEPQEFMVVTWCTRPSMVIEGTEGDYRRTPIPGYVCGDQVVTHFQRYRVNFTTFKADTQPVELEQALPRAAQSR